MAKLKELQVFLRGGLGNQLFQYSTGLFLASQFGKRLVLRGDLLPEKEDAIGGISRWPNQLIYFYHSGEVRTNSFQPDSKTNILGKTMQIIRLLGDLWPNTMARFGWLASEQNSSQELHKYGPGLRVINSYASHKHIAWANRQRLRSEILNLVAPSQFFLDKSKEILTEPTVIVHIRQGDYINLRTLYGEVSLDYLRKAVDLFSREHRDSRVWLFTDSPEALDFDVLDLIKPAEIIGPHMLPSSIENLVLMSLGSAIVASNSTFSWWACFLSQKDTQIIAPIMRRASISVFQIEEDGNQGWELIDV